MKITRAQLKQIIKEEMEKVLNEDPGDWIPGETTLVPERPGKEGTPTEFGEYGEFEGDPATLQQIIQALKAAGLKEAAEHLENQFGHGIERWEFPSRYGGAE
tara:strand:+ start:22 stop:327 length:306 start_codon:yes stop_codon:yes gene_type:complete